MRSALAPSAPIEVTAEDINNADRVWESVMDTDGDDAPTTNVEAGAVRKARKRAAPEPSWGLDSDNPVAMVASAIAKLPGFSRRSGERLARHLLADREGALMPLLLALQHAHHETKSCGLCGNIGFSDPCGICTSDRRNRSLICVVETVDALQAMENAGYSGLYQVIGRILSTDDNDSYDRLPLFRIECACEEPSVQEVIMALRPSPEASTTAALIEERIARPDLKISHLAVGTPMGADIEKLDEATLSLALRHRRRVDHDES